MCQSLTSLASPSRERTGREGQCHPSLSGSGRLASWPRIQQTLASGLGTGPRRGHLWLWGDGDCRLVRPSQPHAHVDLSSRGQRCV